MHASSRIVITAPIVDGSLSALRRAGTFAGGPCRRAPPPSIQQHAELASFSGAQRTYIQYGTRWLLLFLWHEPFHWSTSEVCSGRPGLAPIDPWGVAPCGEVGGPAHAGLPAGRGADLHAIPKANLLKPRRVAGPAFVRGIHGPPAGRRLLRSSGRSKILLTIQYYYHLVSRCQ